MIEYVAFLRGIMPMNPNMRGAKLRQVRKELGLHNVRTVISSGNVLFESGSKDVTELESTIEAAWPAKLGFNSTTIVRSRQQIEEMVQSDPFRTTKYDPEARMNVTFMKSLVHTRLNLPYRADNGGYTVLGIRNQEIFTVSDPKITKTPDVMNWLEKEFGKEITTRTWLTIHRILKKFDV